MSTRRVCALVALSICLDLTMAYGQPPTTDQTPFTLRYSLKSTALLSRSPADPVLFPDRSSATGLWRFRVEPAGPLGGHTSFELAFEQRLRVFSSGSSPAGAGVLPQEAAAPFRVRQLDWQLAASSNAEWRGEIDRAAIHAHLPAVDLTIGRQAIGWGRGVLFGAVDLFAPFTPLEADREWRRGVDAVRADVKLGDRTSVDAIAAPGDSVDRSAYAARLRGYAGKADLEIVGGRRARDLFSGAATSAAVGDAEIHGEVAVFRTPAVPGSDAFISARSVVKAVAGGSYRFGVGAGLLMYAEYHYSGFGADSPGGMLAQLQDPAFQERYLRGDTQILGRHATAVLGAYQLSPEASLSTLWLESPVDGSGVIVPSATLTFGDRWSMVLSGYVPYGRQPVGLALGSQFGAAPLALFVQLRMYR